jgi:hypothetical protein
VDLWSGAFLQFAVSLAALAPLSFAFEGRRVEWTWQLLARLAFLVVLASIFAVNALHTLMRHGQAARVTSMLYLTPPDCRGAGIPDVRRDPDGALGRRHRDHLRRRGARGVAKHR